MSASEPLLVVAGVLEDPNGRVLIAKRPLHKHHGGCWEFPGGKLEPGESIAAALARELDEELGVVVGASARLGVVAETRTPRDLHLLVQRVLDWRGTPQALEHSELAWCLPTELQHQALAPADRRIADWLCAPVRLAITPGPETRSESEWSARIDLALGRGAQRVHFRSGAQSWAAYPDLLARLVAQIHDAGAVVALHDLPELAAMLNVQVLHLSERVAHQFTTRTDLSWSGPLGVSIHAETDPAWVERLQPDYLMLGQIHDTASHPDRHGMGWSRFSDVAAAFQAPVYAIGGVAPNDLALAKAHGALGIASISAFFSN